MNCADFFLVVTGCISYASAATANRHTVGSDGPRGAGDEATADQ